jgi:hypothetical protein
MASNDFKNLCGVWLSDARPDKPRYMSGTLTREMINEILSCSNEGDGSVRIFIHRNNQRPGKKDPDYRVSCVKCQPKEQKPAGTQAPPPLDNDKPF